MTSSTIATLIATMTEVTRDESLMPRTSTVVISSTMNTAGMLTVASSPAIEVGSGMPRSSSSWLR
jgi:hypothetical protein